MTLQEAVYWCDDQKATVHWHTGYMGSNVEVVIGQDRVGYGPTLLIAVERAIAGMEAEKESQRLAEVARRHKNGLEMPS